MFEASAAQALRIEYVPNLPHSIAINLFFIDALTWIILP